MKPAHVVQKETSPAGVSEDTVITVASPSSEPLEPPMNSVNNSTETETTQSGTVQSGNETSSEIEQTSTVVQENTLPTNASVIPLLENDTESAVTEQGSVGSLETNTSTALHDSMENKTTLATEEAALVDPTPEATTDSNNSIDSAINEPPTTDDPISLNASNSNATTNENLTVLETTTELTNSSVSDGNSPKDEPSTVLETTTDSINSNTASASEPLSVPAPTTGTVLSVETTEEDASSSLINGPLTTDAPNPALQSSTIKDNYNTEKYSIQFDSNDTEALYSEIGILLVFVILYATFLCRRRNRRITSAFPTPSPTFTEQMGLMTDIENGSNQNIKG